jgi:ectoine hydroxylase-related dioxygenase (phytanoyl-CoA dioxygenase family)
VNVQYCAGFCRTQQNHYLGIPPEITRTFSERLLELCGYSLYKGIMGHIDGQAPGRRARATGGSRSAPTPRQAARRAPNARGVLT